MMKFYWYDHTATKEKPTLDGLAKLVHLFNASEIASPNDFGSTQFPRLGFIHAGVRSKRTANDWEAVAGDKAWIVFVSSEPIGQQNVPRFVHNFKKPSKDVAAHVTDTIAEAFINSCNGGQPNFDLFYPHPTDNLTALYLLELANQDTDEVNEVKKLVRPVAEEEYFEIKGKDAKLPENRDLLLMELRAVLSPSK